MECLHPGSIRAKMPEQKKSVEKSQSLQRLAHLDYGFRSGPVWNSAELTWWRHLDDCSTGKVDFGFSESQTIGSGHLLLVQYPFRGFAGSLSTTCTIWW